MIDHPAKWPPPSWVCGLNIPRPIANLPTDAQNVGFTFEPKQIARANVRFIDRLETWTILDFGEEGVWRLGDCERIKFFETRT